MQSKYTLYFRAVNRDRETTGSINFYLAQSDDMDHASDIIKEYANDFMNFAHAKTGVVTIELKKYDDDGVTLISVHEATHDITRNFKENSVVLEYRSRHGKIFL